MVKLKVMRMVRLGLASWLGLVRVPILKSVYGSHLAQPRCHVSSMLLCTVEQQRP